MAEIKVPVAMTKAVSMVFHWVAVGVVALVVSSLIAYVIARIVHDDHVKKVPCEERECFRVISGRVDALESECAKRGGK